MLWNLKPFVSVASQQIEGSKRVFRTQFDGRRSKINDGELMVPKRVASTTNVETIINCNGVWPLIKNGRVKMIKLHHLKTYWQNV